MQPVKTILLVEDEAIIALTEANTIKHFGYEVTSVFSGEDAVKVALDNSAICLILMDIDLGRGIDGTEAARQILAKRNIPIVFLTSHSEREMVAKVRGITRFGYVIKNSGDFVLQSSIEMAFELFDSFEKIREKEAELLKEQDLLRALLDNSKDYIYFKDRESSFIRASLALAHSFGMSDPTQMLGKTDFDFFTEEHARNAYEDEQEIIRTGKRLIKEEKETRSDRPDAWVSTEKLPFRDKEGNIIGTFGISRDITEHKRAEERIEFHTRLYATLSRINRTIVHVKEQAILFDKICESVVTTGKFRMAWIGILDQAGGKITRVAQAGTGDANLEGRSDILSEVPMARSPIGAAIHSGKVVLYEDPADAGRKTDRGGDFRSSAVIPFGAQGSEVGILNIYATESGFFSQEERGLLEEIGIDISFALRKIDLEKNQGEQMKRRSTDKEQ